MTKTLDQFITPNGRFARSANVERDTGSDAVEGYLPTGRGLDVVRRVCRACLEPTATRAFSITGPYGSGKSSLAVFIDALLGPREDPAHLAARGILDRVDAEASAVLDRGRQGADRAGFIRAVVTATREPVVATVVRALSQGVERYRRTSRAPSGLTRVQRDLKAAVEGLDDRKQPLPTVRFVSDVLTSLGKVAPVLIVIDEFGKNIEAFADTRGEADLYLLQTIAERSQGSSLGFPLLTITMQHLAFEDYVDAASVSQRREWAKIQGRFEDVPYVDTPAQTRHLIAAVWERSRHKSFVNSLKGWQEAQAKELRRVGLITLIDDAAILGSCWPLHPLTLLVLPELCARYGQNERTLFSFLASQEPLGVSAWLSEHSHRAGESLPAIRADRVYDYFVDSASTMITASQAAGRWLEPCEHRLGCILKSHSVIPADRVGVASGELANGCYRSAQLRCRMSDLFVGGGSSDGDTKALPRLVVRESHRHENVAR